MLRKSDEPTLVLTNRHKVFWPDEGYTKGDLLDYYRDIAPVILPHLQGRPQSLHRHVDGWQGKEFWQRISRTQPPWVRTARVNNRRGELRNPLPVLCPAVTMRRVRVQLQLSPSMSTWILYAARRARIRCVPLP